MRELSNAEKYFRCKHGALPDPGEFGDVTLRYFGWDERFIFPFVNRTNMTRMKKTLTKEYGQKKAVNLENGETIDGDDDTENLSPWSHWSFNATRRKCVHEGANIILSMPPSDEKESLLLRFKEMCSVC